MPRLQFELWSNREGPSIPVGIRDWSKAGAVVPAELTAV